jgi:hypothetical protein
MERPIPMEEIAGLECKHVICSIANDNSGDDLLVIKENVHSKSGAIIPHVHFIQNFKRNFYITKENFRNHEDKKEFEDLDKLQEYTTNQGRLLEAASKALGRYGNSSLRQLANSPYLYGTDITSSTLLKQRYQEKYPDSISNNSVAVIDLETDVVKGHEQPIYVGVTFRDRAFLGVTAEFIGDIPDAATKLSKTAHNLLQEHFTARNIQLEVKVCVDAGEACWEALQRLHQWRPDFLTMWNMNFDMPRIIKALIDNGYNPADAFSDPQVPERFRFYKYKEGPTKKTTASNKVQPLKPEERWHVMTCPASFYIIDSMCLYKRIRMAEQNEFSYKLDYQLHKHIGKRKLNVPKAELYTGLAWHEFMQTECRLEYGAYNLFDCIGVELLDEKIKDLAQTISVQSGPSEYGIFKSQPNRLVDQFYFFCLKRNKILASCGLDMTSELDKLTPALKDIILTLPAHCSIGGGIHALRELPDVKCDIHLHVSDLDIVSSYPFSQVILNISKQTTYREVCKIQDASLEVQLLQGINLLGSHVNAYEVAATLYKAPTFDQLLEGFEASYTLP